MHSRHLLCHGSLRRQSSRHTPPGRATQHLYLLRKYYQDRNLLWRYGHYWRKIDAWLRESSAFHLFTLTFYVTSSLWHGRGCRCTGCTCCKLQGTSDIIKDRQTNLSALVGRHIRCSLLRPFLRLLYLPLSLFSSTSFREHCFALPSFIPLLRAALFWSTG